MSPSRITTVLRRLFGLTIASPIRTSLKARSANRARLSLTALEDRTVPTVVTVASIEVFAENANAAEGVSNGLFRFTRTDTTGALPVYFTVGGTATEGIDFTAFPWEVTFLDGSATVDLAVVPIDDSVAEPTETVTITLPMYSPNNNYVGESDEATVAIADNDAGAAVSGSITAVRSDGYGEAEEGWVAENDDNDNYNFVGDPDTSIDQIADKDELGAVAGEDDLVAIHFDPITGAVSGDTARLHFTSANIRVWMNADKSGGQIINGVTAFDPLVGHTVYAEGVGLSAAVNAESVALEWMSGTIPGARQVVDQLRLTVYGVKGALNVPGYSRHTYVTTVPGQVAATYGAIAGGTQHSVVPSAPAPGGGATANALIVNWGEGEGVGTYQVNLPGGFFVNRRVNIVKVQLDIAGADNKLELDAFTQTQRTGRDGVDSAPQYDSGGIPSMYASIKVARVAGPLVDGARRGQQFIDAGFMQTVTHVRKRGAYTALSLPDAFNMISNTEGKTYIDSIEVDDKPWYEIVYDPTKKDFRRHAGFAPAAPVVDKLFDMADAMDWRAVENMVEEQIMVGRFELKAEFVTYFAVHTSETVNNAKDSYTIRASIPWTWNASGNVDGGPLFDPVRDAAGRPAPTGNWTLDANVTTLSTPVNPKKFVEVTSGEIVPTVLTKGASSHEAMAAETWRRDPESPFPPPSDPPPPPGLIP